MADFDFVHRHSLSNAMAALHQKKGDVWNVIVLEPMTFNPSMSETGYFITVVIESDGKLHPANEVSATIIKEWKERYKNTPNSSFEPWQYTKPKFY